MKQLTCEICGSTDLLKQNGVFVCQACGTKYSVEEAKKMMVEGTVKVDNSEKIAKYYQLARTAKDENDSETAAKYYALIREDEPESWEAKFYTVYFEAEKCKVKDAYAMCQKLKKIAPAIVSSIKTNESAEKQVGCVLEIAEKINEIAQMFLNGKSEAAANDAPYLTLLWGDELEEKFSDCREVAEQAVLFWEKALAVIIDTCGTGEEEVDHIVEQYAKKIKKYNNQYVVPKSNISVHTPSSPNKATVDILGIGHIDFTTAPLIPIPVRYIAHGPDSAGGVSVELKLKNIKGKTIKYATLYITAFDRVGNPAACTVHGEATRALSITGPIEAGKDSGELIFETIWYNHTITSVKMHSMIVEYTDGTKEKYKHDEYIHGANTLSRNNSEGQLATLTVTRNEMMKTLVSVNLTCVLDSNEKFRLGYMETVTIPVKPGRHRIDLEFKGRFLVPAKYKSAEFYVDGDVFIELKRNYVWGGYTTKII